MTQESYYCVCEQDGTEVSRGTKDECHELADAINDIPVPDHVIDECAETGDWGPTLTVKVVRRTITKTDPHPGLRRAA